MTVPFFVNFCFCSQIYLFTMGFPPSKLPSYMDSFISNLYNSTWRPFSVSKYSWWLIHAGVTFVSYPNALDVDDLSDFHGLDSLHVFGDLASLKTSRFSR